MEALLARKSLAYFTKVNASPVVYSRLYRANVNPVCDSDSNVKPIRTAPANGKQASSNPCHASISIQNTPANVKHMVLSDAGEANVKHVCEANVKHFCNNVRGSDNGTLSPDISMYENRPHPRWPLKCRI